MFDSAAYFNDEIASPGSMPGDGRFVCRFAPSPTGRMHAGNIFSSLISWIIGNRSGGGVVLRIEDLDASRSKPELADQIMRDYEMLGLTWDKGPYYQHDRSSRYSESYNYLKSLNLTYPCYCTRADLHAASAPHAGDRFVYNGTCRNLAGQELLAKKNKADSIGRAPSQRLIVPDSTFEYFDLLQGMYSENLMHDCGDFIIRRSDQAFAYQLAVVIDDNEQGVSCIVRGSDLLSSTPQQLYVQELLGYPKPAYAHVPLMMGEDGRRLSKRHASANLENMLDEYKTPKAVLGHIAYVSGIIEEDAPASADEILKYADLNALKNVQQIIWR